MGAEHQRLLRTADLERSHHLRPRRAADDRTIDPAVPTFHCRRCGTCCRWHGSVHLTPEDIQNIAALLGLSEDAFIQQHTTLAPARNGLSLKERTDGACIFLTTENHCRIYPVRPQQCCDFPHRWSDPDCPALQGSPE